MKQFLVKLMGEDGWIYQMRVEAVNKDAAYFDAQVKVLKATHGAEQSLTFFSMEEGALGPAGWVSYNTVSL